MESPRDDDVVLVDFLRRMDPLFGHEMMTVCSRIKYYGSDRYDAACMMTLSNENRSRFLIRQSPLNVNIRVMSNLFDSLMNNVNDINKQMKDVNAEQQRVKEVLAETEATKVRYEETINKKEELYRYD